MARIRLFVNCMSLTLAVALCSGTAAAQAMQDRLALIGVITGAKGKFKDTAILKDLSSKRSIAVRKGESIKEFPGFKVVSIEPKKVLLAGNGQKVTLTHEGFPSDGKSSTGAGGEYESMVDGPSNEYFAGGGEMPPPLPPPPPPDAVNTYTTPYTNTYNGNGQPLPPIDDVNRYNPPPPPPPIDMSHEFQDEPMPMYTETFYDGEWNTGY